MTGAHETPASSSKGQHCQSTDELAKATKLVESHSAPAVQRIGDQRPAAALAGSDIADPICREKASGVNWTELLLARCDALLAGALDETTPCPTDLRKRLPKHKSRGAQEQDGDGDTDDDIWPERLEPGY